MTVSTTIDRLQLLIGDALTVDVPGADVDLFDAGLIDSLGLVTIIAEIEVEFEVELSLDDFDVDRFRTIERIAEYLADVGATAR
jgi:D-alanine--poly(phosphoribitol) ligase subunit 2